MRLFYLNKSTKVWLISSIFVLLVNLIVFIFKKHFDTDIVFWVVLLTPVAVACNRHPRCTNQVHQSLSMACLTVKVVLSGPGVSRM